MGKNIGIYLSDGSVSGIRFGEIRNWTGQALACPRARFGSLKDWPEVRRPGIYFLFGVDEESGRDLVYVGEAEVVLDRLTAHVTGKEFWTEVVIFTSKDEHLTKGHVRYLECRLVELIAAAGRHQLTNSTYPALPSLPRGERDAMEEFIENIRVLTGVLGHRPLDPLSAKWASLSAEPQATLENANAAPHSGLGAPTSFYLRVSGLIAMASRTDEGIVVLAGSDSTLNIQPSLSTSHKAKREQLIAAGVLVQSGNKYKFSRDSLFNSPSQAAAVIVGYSTNGRENWRTSDNQSWGAVEAKATRNI
ncbi:MAG: GIY-YIG nuclease family protein [Comamonadaceae bacterium]|nr:MAG: GIY-YIG nuclease family protein [Comamonadaceae bacterium]